MRRAASSLRAAVLLLGATSTPPEPARYTRYELFELALCAERVLTGEIRSVDSSTFVLSVEQRVVGTLSPETLSVARFEDWACASRWTEYRVGQRVLLFLGASVPDSNVQLILGAGGEGEMPLAGAQVVVREYDVRGYPRAWHEVRDGKADGTLVDLDEVVSAVRGFRAAFRWQAGTSRPIRVEPVDEELARAFEASSPFAAHLVDEARSSNAWTASFDEGERRIPSDELRSIPMERPDALAFLGDVDGDGIVDLAVGDRSAGGAGAARILFLERHGGVKASVEIGNGTGSFPVELRKNSWFGSAIAPIGDLNADHVPDVAFGAPRWSGADGRGGVWIAFLARDGRIASAVELGSSPQLTSAGVTDGARLGAALAPLGDLDGDGLPELAIGQEPASSPRSVWIVSLDRTGDVRWARRHDRAGASSVFGAALACVDDLDGDGTSDLALADGDEAGGRSKSRGSVWIDFLARDGTSKGWQRIGESSGGFTGRIRGWGRFGHGLAAPGDVDGDGIPDLVVGSSSGLWTLRLGRDGTVRSHDLQRDPVPARGADRGFGRSMAWEGTRATRGRLAVVGAVGVWFFSLDELGRLAAW